MVALDNTWLVYRDAFKNNLAVNVATVVWDKSSYFGRFGWNQPPEEVQTTTDRR